MNNYDCYNEAIRRLSYRLYSSKELKTYLTQKGFNENNVCDTIQTLIEKSLLDDKNFIRLYITGRGMRRLMSINSLKYELKSLVNFEDGFDDYIEEVYNEFNGGENFIIEKLIFKKINDKNLNELSVNDEQKLIKFILSKGFNYKTIKNVINEFKK